MSSGTALSVERLSKTFGVNRVLENVSFAVSVGEIHAILGQNGSGKSTLIRVLAGVYAPDPGGRVAVFGHRVQLPIGGRELRQRGMSFVHQDLGLIPHLSVLENLRVAELTAKRSYFINWSREREQAEEALARFSVDLALEDRVSRLSLVDRARLALVRAFELVRFAQMRYGSPGLLVLDEPTAFLPRDGVEQLFAMMRDIVARAASVIFVSHDLDEVRAITDRITVLRDGNVVASLVTADCPRETIIRHIVGELPERVLSDTRRKRTTQVGSVVANVEGTRLCGTELTISNGEILGVTGLIGSGYEQLLYHLFGASRARAGRLILGGGCIELVSLTPRRAIRLGIGFLPGDRQGASGIGSLDIPDNLFMPRIERFFRVGFLRRREMYRAAQTLVERFDVRCSDPTTKLRALSGGNAQKILLARWLNLAPRLLLLEEPTQGVDVGARRQLTEAIRSAASAGSTIVIASSDHQQLADVCDRVCIFRHGSLVAEIGGGELSRPYISELCYSDARPHRRGKVPE